MTDERAFSAAAVPAGWVPCAERMPPPDRRYLVWFSGDCIGIAHTFSKWKHPSHPLGYLIQGHGGSHNDVTHWMPLPPAPGAAPPQFTGAGAVSAQFNAAINFAIEQGIEAATFLTAWREGDMSEWPEFVAAAPATPTMADAVAAGDGTLHGAIDRWQERALKAEAALASRASAAPVAVDADLDAINKMADALMVAWSKAEPEHSITRNPVSYTATFVDMARAALRAVGAGSREPLTDEQISEAVRDADLDWHHGWTLDENEPNRFTQFARAIEAAHGIAARGNA